MDLTEYARAFDEVERDFETAVEAWGLSFEDSESSPRGRRRLCADACGCRCENGGASLVSGWVSPACLACRTGEETVTFYVDLRCTRDCYFCFNPNQDHYEYFCHHRRDITAELEEAHAAGARFRCIAVTGGEPLLHSDEVLRFLRRARELYPGVHTRLYTSGDRLDAELLRELADAGLAEMRFSVKPPDAPAGAVSPGGAREGVETSDDPVWGIIAKAVGVVPDVVIEIPVIPGTQEWMEDLLRRADALGVRGVNLLEFCFPLHNAEEFRKRGFRLRKHPYNYLYDYWYGGGIPVAGSEDEALALMEFAAREGLRLGLHYCSSDNKNTGQVYQQNGSPEAVAYVRERYPWMTADADDRFMKCAKAFGADARLVHDWAERSGFGVWGYDEEVPCVSIPLSAVPAIREALPAVALAESANIVEAAEDGTLYLREVGIDPLSFSE